MRECWCTRSKLGTCQASFLLKCPRPLLSNQGFLPTVGTPKTQGSCSHVDCSPLWGPGGGSGYIAGCSSIFWGY